MKNYSPAELQLHFAILENGASAFETLNDQYSDYLLKFLHRWYKKHLQQKPSFANEAVYNSIQWYCAHPRAFNPEQGSMRRFLEIRADKMLQSIFEKENYAIHITGADHMLAKYFDNEQDVMLAKLLLKNENNICSYVQLMNIGGYRIKHQLNEVKRNKERIQKKLDKIALVKKLRKKGAEVPDGLVMKEVVFLYSDTERRDFHRYRQIVL